MKRIACFGEMLLRVGPRDAEPLLRTPALEGYSGGAEANVAVSLACLGQRSSMITVVPDNALGDACIGELRRHGVETGAVRRSADRLGLYLLVPGGPLRPAQVIYDRAHSGFALIPASSYDWRSLLGGADWLHVSGITAALGEAPLVALREAIATAARLGVRISFDCNFRASLWHGREADAALVLADLARHADLLFAGVRDVAVLFGKDYGAHPASEGFALAAGTVLAACPRLQWLATTHREVRGFDEHVLTGMLADRAGISCSTTYVIRPVIDRIGSGDAYAAGLLHSLCEGADRAAAVQFAAAAAALKHGVRGDFNPSTAADVRRLIENGGLDLRR
ncbi:MAG: sugar kinase [Steroidobacteraceae bacterium]